jgi:hypothetical protein
LVSFYRFVSQAHLHAGIPVAALPLFASAGMLCKFSLSHTHTQNKSTENCLDLLPDMNERSNAGGVSSSLRYASHDGPPAWVDLERRKTKKEKNEMIFQPAKTSKAAKNGEGG